jgi:hypothetical protein
MLTTITKSVIAATAFSLLTIGSLGISDRSYAIALNLTTFTVGGDATLDSPTQATIQSGTPLTLATGGGAGSLEEFLVLAPGAFDTLFPNNFFGSAIKKSVLVTIGDVLTFNLNFTKDANDGSFVTVGTDVFLLANATSTGTYTYTFTTTGNVNLGIGVIDVDDATGESTLIITDADIAPVPFEFEASGGLLVLGGLFLGKRYLRKSKEK